MATPPTRVLYSTPAVGYISTASPKTTPTFDVVNGDLLTVMGTTQESPTTMPTPTSTGTVTWTLRQSISLTSYCVMYAWTGAVTADGTGITVSIAAGTGGQWGFGVTVWRNHGGVGANVEKNLASGAPILPIACYVNSAVICASSDYTATAGGSRTWRSVNGSAMSESLYATSGASYTVYSGYSLDTGAAGLESVGLSLPGAQKYSMIALEILSADAGPPPPAIALREAGASTLVAATATTLNPVVPATATTGDLSVLWVEAKPYNTAITTPSGWTKIGEATNGTTAATTDLGSMLIACYVKESATPGAIGAMTLTSADSACAVIHTYSKYDGTYTWDYSAFTTGSDATQSTNYSATGAAGLDVITDDWVLCGTAVNSDLGTNTITSQTIGGMSGATLYGAVRTGGTATGDGLVTTGTDSRLIVVDTDNLAGSSNAAPTMTYTLAQTQSGTSLWLRLREIAPAAAVPLPVIVSRQAIRAPSYW